LGVADAWRVIHEMTVRGAPLIASVASFGLAVEASNRTNGKFFEEKITTQPHSIISNFSFFFSLIDDLVLEKKWANECTAHLRTSRPTAVNLFAAMDQIDRLISNANSAIELRENV
jgi:methylthioribose-1-phosphate isomerase